MSTSTHTRSEAPAESRATPWHALDPGTALKTLESSEQGLSSDEAQRRLERDGPNKLPETKPRSALLRFLAQFNNVLIYALLVAGTVTFYLDHLVDAAVIFGVVLANAIIGFIQEGKAEDALAAIRQMLSPQAMVRRDGHQRTIESVNLVIGDVVHLQSGDRVPADLRLCRAKGLMIDEAALTGESVASEKHSRTLVEETPLADRDCMAYSGTLVTSGQGVGVVVASGAATEIGRISTLVARTETLTTPLLRQMDQFSRWLTAVILVVALLTFWFGISLRDYGAAEMFLAAVGLAVAAIPEGLPAIMTITLAIGVQRMARRNAIIRRLPAVETLGAVTVICSDKTGTLTHNEMAVRSIATADAHYDISGSGYDPHGVFTRDGEEIDPWEVGELRFALRGGLLCNDSRLSEEPEGHKVHGDPMEGALVVAGLKAVMDPQKEMQLYPRDDIIPFESDHKFMATLHHGHRGESFVCIKGAPERILAMCDRQRMDEEFAPLDPEYWHRQIEALAERGQRVLAFATKDMPPGHRELEFDDVEDGMVMLCLFGLIDPPRQEAVEAVRLSQRAGIRVVMITGDHAATARAIARHLNLANHQQALTGAEIDQLDDDTLRQRVGEVDVYARVTPEHKLRLVTLLQQRGWIVAMTGDGVNDAPALKRADVGVAMGQKGTEAAKEASEMVLADDNFASITHAVEEGRTVYDNLRKAILFILPTNGGQALVIIAAILLGLENLPLTPVQILWVNMITAVTMALALAFEPPEAGVMSRPPRDPDQPVLTGNFIWRIGFISLILTAGTFGLFHYQMQTGGSIEQGRTMAVNTLVMFEMFYLFNSRYIYAPVLNREGLTGNKYVLYAVGLVIVFQLAFTYWGGLQTLFGTAPISLSDWGIIILTASSVLFLVEGEKWLVRRRHAARS